MAEPLPSKQKTRVRFSLPAPTSRRPFAYLVGHRALNPGRLVRTQEGQPLQPARHLEPVWPAQLQQRGIAQSVERGSHTPRQPQVRSLLPRPSFAGLAKWEGNGSWPRHEAVRFRQPVRACSSSVSGGLQTRVAEGSTPSSPAIIALSAINRSSHAAKPTLSACPLGFRTPA
jgi:hypothetical protein